MTHQIETRLEEFGWHLLKWNKRFALTSRSTPDFWKTHWEYIDEARLLSACLDSNLSVTDIGSGNGYPAVPLAIFGHDIRMVDSSQKKTSFLKNVGSQLGLQMVIQTKDVEQLSTPALQIVTKAFASVTRTLHLTRNIRDSKTACFMLKGEKILEEIAEAETHYTFSFKLHPFRSNNKGVLELWNVKDVR